MGSLKDRVDILELQETYYEQFMSSVKASSSMNQVKLKMDVVKDEIDEIVREAYFAGFWTGFKWTDMQKNEENFAKTNPKKHL